MPQKMRWIIFHEQIMTHPGEMRKIKKYYVRFCDIIIKTTKQRRFFMNAIVTVIGKDRVGIIAAVCIKLAAFNINILDISQTILQGSFTMVMVVDVAAANASFGEISSTLSGLGKEMGLSIRIQREEIFDAMHEI